MLCVGRAHNESAASAAQFADRTRTVGYCQEGGPWHSFADLGTGKTTGVGHEAYLRQLQGVSFVLCTHGGGIDPAPKAFEALVAGAIPIIQSSALDASNFETFEDPRRQELHIIMEMCTGGALVSRMKTHRHGYGEKAAATLLEKALSATMYCHKHGVVHRDIKLDNFIYENEAEDAELKLIDFGFASFVAPGKESMWDQIGTPSYMAPELWSERQKARAPPSPPPPPPPTLT